MGAEVVQLIKTELLRRGKGIEGSPLRIITQYWSFEGELLFENDPWKDHLEDPNSELTISENGTNKRG
ncbi:hypothetical protein [Flagellimonas flava]|uniref:hypothetical protein n=1 Tax=Flagellimonas flava TaxID=570519 RepID=UPI003D64D6D2